MENRDSTEDSEKKTEKQQKKKTTELKNRKQIHPKTQQKTQFRTQLCIVSLVFSNVPQISHVFPSKSAFHSQVFFCFVFI
jgi:hypothetical protein